MSEKPLKECEVKCSKCGARYVANFRRDYYGGENGRGGLCENCFLKSTFQGFKRPDPVPVDEKRLKDLCLPGKGQAACRYLAMMGEGMHCAKGSALQSAIDQRAGTMRAQGDNCSGPPDFMPAA